MAFWSSISDTLQARCRGQLGEGACRGMKEIASAVGEQSRQSSSRLIAMASQGSRVVKSQLLFASH